MKRFFQRAERETSRDRKESRYANSKSQLNISKESKLHQVSKRESSRSRKIRTESNERRTSKTGSESLKEVDVVNEVSRNKPGRLKEKKSTLDSYGKQLTRQDRSRTRNDPSKTKTEKRSQSKDSNIQHSKNKSLFELDKSSNKKIRTESKITPKHLDTKKRLLSTNDKKTNSKDEVKRSRDKDAKNRSHGEKRRDSKSERKSNNSDREQTSRHKSISKSHHSNGASSHHQKTNRKENIESSYGQQKNRSKSHYSDKSSEFLYSGRNHGDVESDAEIHETVPENVQNNEAISVIEEKFIFVQSIHKFDLKEDIEIVPEEVLESFTNIGTNELENQNNESEHELSEELDENNSGDYNYDEDEFENIIIIILLPKSLNITIYKGQSIFSSDSERTARYYTAQRKNSEWEVRGSYGSWKDYDSDFENESDAEDAEESEETNENVNDLSNDNGDILVKEEHLNESKMFIPSENEENHHQVENAEQKDYSYVTNEIISNRSDSAKSDKSVMQQNSDDDVLQKSNNSDGFSHFSDLVKESPIKSRINTPKLQEKVESKQDHDIKSTKNIMSFSETQKREKHGKVLSKIRTRADELNDLITLDTNYFDLFDLPPVNYEVYIKNFGRMNAKQVCIQTDSYSEAECQTNEIIHRQKWTQFPSHHDLHCCGGEKSEEDEHISWEFRVKTDVLKLNNFLQSVEPVIITLLQESGAEIYRKNLVSNQANISFSDGFTHLVPPSFRKDCPITYVKFSPIQENYLLTIHGTPTRPSNIPNLDDKGIICVWNLFVPSFPDKILSCASQPLCACFSPAKANLIFAGMVDGSVALWDFTESNVNHENYAVGDFCCVVRTPSYCTAEVLREESHLSAVISIKSVMYGNKGKCRVGGPSVAVHLLSRTQPGCWTCANGASSFEIATLEENAIIKFWLVVEERHQEVHGSLTDLGLAPNSKMKLVLSSTITVQAYSELDGDLSCGMKVHDLEFNSSSSNHLYIATDAGSILHHTKNGSSAIPKMYINDTGLLCDIQSIDFSPHNLPYFLAGCSDGTVLLFSIRSAQPVMTWSNVTGGVPVLTVKWSRSQPSLFFALDITSKVHVWDLSQDDAGPSESCHFTQGRIMSFDLSVDFNEQTSSKPAIAFAMDDSSVEVHQISKKFSSVPEDRFHQLSVNVTSL
ncbi:WD repeat-containing protein 60 [Nymphon striatum]|nr:WD repeat-containing protein 60 [Nymphon striatum]